MKNVSKVFEWKRAGEEGRLLSNFFTIFSERARPADPGAMRDQYDCSAPHGTFQKTKHVDTGKSRLQCFVGERRIIMDFLFET